MGSNGHKKGGFNLADPSATDGVGAGIGLFKDGELEGMLQNVEQTSFANYFVSPGKDAKELFARTRIKDDNEINRYVLYIARCQKFGIKNGLEMLQNKLAMRKSINGMSLDELLQLGTQQLRREKQEAFTRRSDKEEKEEKP